MGAFITNIFSSIMMDDPVQNLKGKILQKPKEHMWRINKQASKEDWKYTVENTAENGLPTTVIFKCKELKLLSIIRFLILKQRMVELLKIPCCYWRLSRRKGSRK